MNTDCQAVSMRLLYQYSLNATIVFVLQDKYVTVQENFMVQGIHSALVHSVSTIPYISAHTHVIVS